MSAGGAVIDRYDAIAFDLDGVLHRGDDAVLAAPAVLDRARASGVPMVFLTNNSSRTPEQVSERLVAMGLDARPEEILTSALATAAMLAAGSASGSTAFVIGGPGITEALASVGITVLAGEPDRADLVVVGWDRTVDYAKLRTASLLVERGARLIGTNPDASFPAADGSWPGAGALLSVITTTTGAAPTIVGKPFPAMFADAARRTSAQRPLMVGDRLDTDIRGAAAAGWDSMLVLTGSSRASDLPAASALPTYLADDVGGLLVPRAPARPREATGADGPAVAALLRSAGLDPDGSPERLSRTVVLPSPDARSPGADAGTGEEGRPAATAALVALEGANYLRSVAVRSDLRHQGLGSLVAAAAIRLGAPAVPTFAASEGAAELFERLGFGAIGPDETPPAVRAVLEAQGCVASATVLRRGARASA